MTILLRSTDRKVANLVSRTAKPVIANTFGLPAGKAFSCPSATSICEKVCYAGKLEKVYKNVRQKLVHNWEALQSCGDDIPAITALLSEMVKDFADDCDRFKAERLFRIHWDGDFYSDSYAMAWRDTILAYPDITFWVYTRVPSAVKILTGLGNLSLYFSTDTENKELGISLRREIPDLKLAWLDITFEKGKSAMLDSLGKSAPRCPENNKAIPLIDANNSACARCRLCIKGSNDVLFSSSKK